MRSKWRKRINYILYVIAVFIVILTGFNVYFTFQIHSQLAEMVSKPGRWPANAYVYNENIGFDFSGGISDYIKDGSFYVKSHQLGYRIGKEEQFNAIEPGGVISFGCSFTYGDEVESGQTFTQLIADSLKMGAYNYGVSSFSYTHALLKAQNLKESGVLDKLQPEYVILGCWSGLLDRSRSAIPPIARSIPLISAHLIKNEQGVVIHPPANYKRAYEMIKLYRDEGTEMNFGRFVKLFFIAPQYVHLFLFNKQNGRKPQVASSGDEVTNYEIYDYYFTSIEKTFASYGSRIIVLYMPYMSFDTPDQALIDALKFHPKIMLIDGLKAIKRYNVPPTEYQKKHPQPAAHMAYAWETIEVLSENGN